MRPSAEPATRPARVLTVAGSDSGGGAGIQADLKTMLVHGVHGMSVITAVTAQNSIGVQGVWPLPAQAVRAQLDSVLGDIGVDAVKTGMLGTAETIATVAAALADVEAPLVVDPVCASKHGDSLIDDDALLALVAELAPLADVLTPNLPEARLLTRADGLSEQAPPAALAEALLSHGPRWVLIKGGHAVGEPTDELFGATGEHHVYTAERSDNRHTHGTGCTLASAIAARLALGDDVPTAVAAAKTYVTGAIRAGFELGAGIGPTDHLWALRSQVSKDAGAG